MSKDEEDRPEEGMGEGEGVGSGEEGGSGEDSSPRVEFGSREGEGEPGGRIPPDGDKLDLTQEGHCQLGW